MDNRFIGILLIIVVILLLINAAANFKPYQLIREPSSNLPYVAYRVNVYTGTITPVVWDSTLGMCFLNSATNVR